jgi:LuxR family transcriptional regulator, positive regulator of biofilm formation
MKQNASVKLITDITPQSQLLVNYIETKLGCNIEPLSPTGDYQKSDQEGKVLILLDADHVNDKLMYQWLGIAADNTDDVVLAAFNIKNEDHAILLLTTLHLQGIFYRTDNLDLICKGISTLLEGELWMTRQLMTRLINFYRRQQINLYRPACGLTNRELEIISLLSNGSSNTEIAEQLYVSEHTVKSHLYNIFKKIKVHNRIQAMNWARENLAITMVCNSLLRDNEQPGNGNDSRRQSC